MDKASPTRVFQAMAVARALDFYAKTGIKVNTAYTPKNMLATATAILGVRFERNQLAEAAAALRVWVAQQRGEVA